MFLLVPASIFIVSAAVVAYIAFRKLGHIKRLNSEFGNELIVSEEMTFSQFIHQMFPEVFGYFKRVDVAAHKSSFLLEFEKFLRRLRLVFLKIDNISNSLIHKIRETHIQETQKSQERIEARKIEDIATSEVTAVIGQDDFKKKEHELIIEIAKNPKNPVLYKDLGYLYIETQQWNYAKESFLSALKLDPTIKGVKRKLDSVNKVISQIN